MKLSETIKEKCGINFGQEIDELIMLQDFYTEKLEKNKLLKDDRERLIEALQIIKLGEYN